MVVTCNKAPCKSCPYRQDVPSGVWSKDEYEKLPSYDGQIIEQVFNNALAAFFCHQNDGKLCAGWISTHGGSNLLALRLRAHTVDHKVWGYKSPVPLFESGREACDHGMRDIKNPGIRAREMIDTLRAQRARLVK